MEQFSDEYANAVADGRVDPARDLAAPGMAEGQPLPADLPLKEVLGALRETEARPVSGGGIVTRDQVLQRLSA